MSTEALQVLAGVLPLDLAILKAAAAWHIRKGRVFRDGDFRVASPSIQEGRLAKALAGIQMRGVRDHVMSKWQERWRVSTKGRTTYTSFPEV
jgi:hypothetical protein